MKNKLLIIEDESKIREIVCDYFNEKDFETIGAANGLEALEIIGYKDFDIILLDVMMPGIDGFGVCKAIRKKSDVPVIFLTARTDDIDKLYGYDMGADDYITKPFSLPVLFAKVMAMIKRKNGSIINNLISSGGITIHPDSQIVSIDGKNVILAPMEYELLLYLMQNKNKVLTRDQIINRLWGYDFSGDDRAVDTHIKKLRKTLGSKSCCIKTVIKRGYKYEDG